MSFTEATVVNFFKPASKKEPEHTTWKVVDDTLLVGTYFNRASPNKTKPAAPDEKRRVAGFDLVRENVFSFLFFFLHFFNIFGGAGDAFERQRELNALLGLANGRCHHGRDQLFSFF